MKLKLFRYYFDKEFTQGRLYINGNYFCDVIEPFDTRVDKTATESKIKALKAQYGKISIPYGEYKIMLTYSNTFKKVLPLVVGTIGFAGIRMHNGNSVLDSRGCLICGEKTGNIGFVANSRKTITKLIEIIGKCDGNVTLEIIN